MYDCKYDFTELHLLGLSLMIGLYEAGLKSVPIVFDRQSNSQVEEVINCSQGPVAYEARSEMSPQATTLATCRREWSLFRTLYLSHSSSNHFCASYGQYSIHRARVLVPPLTSLDLLQH